MASPTVTATITGNDLLTAVLEKALANSKATAGKIIDAAEEHASRHASIYDRMQARFGASAKAIDGIAAGMFAGMGTHFLHEASHIATEMSGLERKMMAFAGLTKRQADDMRRQADTTFSGSTGGPVGQMELATQLLNNGFNAQQIPGMMLPVSLYATETNQALGEAATEFAGHMAMLHRIHDDAGKELSIGQATPEQVKRAAEETFGALTGYFKEMQGSFKDVMEFSKVAGPTSTALKVPEHFMFAEEAVLSQQGIRGEVAGTAILGFNRRLIGQTSKGRAAMAEAGLHYSDYVQLNPELLTAEGVEAAFAQRAGTANAAEKAKIAAAVDKFHRDHDFDAVNEALINAFSTSGNKGLQNRVAAANAAADITKGAVVGIDQEKFLQDVHDKNVSTGLLQTMFRESANAVMILAQNIDELKRVRSRYDQNENQGMFDAAKKEQFDNYAGAQQNLKGAYQGFQAEVFSPLEGPLTHVFNTVAEGLKSVAGAGDSTKHILDAVLVSGSFIGGLKVSGKLAEVAGGLVKLATGAEEVGPLVGALGLLADVPFLPIVAGIGAVVAGFEAFEHRAELWHAFENWKNGTVDAPTTPAEADELRGKVDRDRKALADHAKAIEDHAAAMDPATRAAREHASEVLRRGLLGVEKDPAVVAARDHLAQVENHNPRHNQSIFDAQTHLREVEAAYAKRQAVTSDHIASLSRVLDRIKHTDPLAGDDDLHRTQTDLAGMRARLGAAAENDPAYRALDEHRKAREAERLDWQRRMVVQAAKMIEEERDQLGAPKVTADDLAAARKAAEGAPAAAQEQHRAAVEQAQADLDRVTAAARRAVEQSQAVIEANAQAEQAADSARNGPQARMEKQADPTIAKLTAEIAKFSGVVADYDHAHGLAEATAHPTFTRPENAPTPPPAAGHGAPTFASPAFDPSHMAPHAPGSSFGLGGPQVDTAALAGSISATIARAIYPERSSQKVDVHSDVAVTGTVQGKGEVSGRVDVAVQPSRYFEGLVRRAEVAGRLDLDGAIGGNGSGDYMGGPNGVGQHPGRNGMPI